MKTVWGWMSLETHDGGVADRAVDRVDDLDLEGDQRGSHQVEEEPELVEPGGDDRGRPLVGCLGLHPRQHVLHPQPHVAAHAREHLLRNRHLQHRLEPILPVYVGAQSPHNPIYVSRKIDSAEGEGSELSARRGKGEEDERSQEGVGQLTTTTSFACLALG